MENKIAWEKYPEGNKREEVFQFAENYRKFISDCKTERECVTSFVEKAEKAGFVNLEKVIAEHTALKAPAGYRRYSAPKILLFCRFFARKCGFFHPPECI